MSETTSRRSHTPPMTPENSHDEAPEEDLAARERAWNRTHDPRALWPALDPATLQPAADAIGRAVSARLRGETTTLGEASGSDAYAIGIAALASGTGPLLGYWVEQGTLDVGDALAIILARHLDHGRRRMERMTRGVSPAFSKLLEAGVTPAVIKGFHTAHVYFPEPGLRPMADVDIVVATEEISAAEEALGAAGFSPSHIVEKPYKRDWYPADDTTRIWSFELFDARDRWKLELHDGANFGYLARFGFRLDGGVRSGAPWSVNGIDVRVPTQPLLTVVLATHLSTELYPRRLLRLIELTYVIRRDRELGRFAWDTFDALLAESGARRFVYPALALVEKLAPGTVDQVVLARGRRASTRLARFVTDWFTPTRPLLEDRRIIAERLMWVASVGDLLQRLAQWVHPLPGASWKQIREIYHGRVRRVLSGRASWRPRDDDGRAGGTT